MYLFIRLVVVVAIYNEWVVNTWIVSLLSIQIVKWISNKYRQK